MGMDNEKLFHYFIIIYFISIWFLSGSEHTMEHTHPCAMCPFFTDNLEDLVKHLVKRHRNAPRFIVHCNEVGCGASFKNYVSFKSHLSRKHGGHNSELCADIHRTNNVSSVDEDVDDPSAHDEVESEKSYDCGASYFMLKLKSMCNVSESGMREVQMSTEYLVQQKLAEVKASIFETNRFTQEEIDGLFDCANQPIFNGLNSTYLLNKSWQKSFSLVEPVKIKLGEFYKNIRGRHNSATASYRVKKHDVYGYYVPFAESLQALLKSSSVNKYTMTHTLNDFGRNDIMTDVFDGQYFQSHPYLTQNPEALVFALYSDDFEITNPIGHHTKTHKLTAFYYVLLNIPPHLRTKLEAIQLVAMAKTTDLKKYGLGTILKNCIESLQKLHDGIEMTTTSPAGDKQRTLIRGMLGFVLGDTPAAQLLGGFKEGVGQAHKPCRLCEVTKEELPNNSIVNPSTPRDEDEHLERCENLSSRMTKEAKKYWSKMYGVNGKTELLNVPEFQVTKCILEDPMHVLLEGIVPMEMKLLLNYCVERKFITILQLNKIILNFEYTDDERRDLPVQINWQNVQSEAKLKQTAQSMKNLLVLLPFMIGEFVPEKDENWVNYLRLVQITLLTFSSVASNRTVETLKVLIAAHHSVFTRLYPGRSVTPKMHYLSHIPMQIRDFGPARCHSCMRLEGKHGECKDKKYRNFRAIHKSVTFQHQRRMCMQQVNSDGSPSHAYLSDDDIVKGGRTCNISEREFYPSMIQREYGDSEDISGSVALHTTELISLGHRYKVGTVLLYEWSQWEYPQFIEINEILIFNNTAYFICTDMQTQAFDSHFNAFRIKAKTGNANIRALKPSVDLIYHWPQIVHMMDRIKFVMLQNVDDVWQL